MSKTVTERCNSCDKIKKSDKEFTLYFANCGHLICDECKTTETCPICNKDTSYVKIDDNLTENLKLFFQDPSEMIKYYGKIVEFQNLQNNLAQNAHIKQRKLFQQQIVQLQKEVKDKTKEIQYLKSRCSDLELELEKRDNQLAALTKVEKEMSTKKKTSLSEDGGSKFNMILKDLDAKSIFFNPSQINSNNRQELGRRKPCSETDISEVNHRIITTDSPSVSQKFKLLNRIHSKNLKNKLTYDNLQYTLK